MAEAGLQSRRRKGKSKHTASEWVDVLYAGEGEQPASGGFALSRLRKESQEVHDAPDEPSRAPERLPPLEPGQAEGPVATDDGLLLKEDHLDRPEKLRLEGRYLAGHRGDAYERSWVRTRSDTIDEIRGYIDNVLAKGKPPEVTSTRRIRGRGAPLGGKELNEEAAQAMVRSTSDIVDRRIVYETKGGYVVAVTRETPTGRRTDYFTVSKVKDVEHALDSIREVRPISERVDAMPGLRQRTTSAGQEPAAATGTSSAAHSSAKPASGTPASAPGSPARTPESGAKREMPTLADTPRTVEAAGGHAQQAAPAKPATAATAPSTAEAPSTPERKGLGARLPFGKRKETTGGAAGEAADEASGADASATESREEKRGLGGLKGRLPFRKKGGDEAPGE